MEKLESARVWRGGASTQFVAESDYQVHARTGGATVEENDVESFTISTMIGSKGGGVTAVGIEIPAAEFDTLAALMFDVAPEAATKAFAKALLRAK